MSTDYYAEDSDEEIAYCYIITNLSANIDRDKLWDVFGAFGTVKQIEINTKNLAAAVIYALKPLDQLHTQRIYIQDRLVVVKRLSLADYLSVESCSVPVLKLSLGGLSTPQIFVEEWSTTEFVSFVLNPNEKYVDVFFRHVGGYYRFRIEYDDSFKDSVLLQRHKTTSSLTISGKYPARFWRSTIPMQRLTDHYHLTDWERIVEIPLDEFSRDIMRQRERMTSKDPILPRGQFPNHTLKLSNWTVYRLEFDCPVMSHNKVAHLDLSPANLSHEALEKKVFAATRTSMPFTPLQVKSPTKQIDLDAMIANLPFELQYMMEHAFNLKILREYNVDADFFQTMQQLPTNVACIFLAQLSAPQQRIYNPNTAINKIYSLVKDHIGHQQYVPDDCMLVRKVLVTPTSIYPLQPTVERMNHLQWQFRQYADRFLLVQFTEEDLTPVKPSLDNDDLVDTKIYDRIFQVLKKGIRIARRTYEFLGTSTEDLQAHQGWFFAKTDEMSRADILMWMGDFREITKISTFVACAGQAFAPRLMELEIEAKEILEIEDYQSYGFGFTNSCGKMSPAIAREIAKSLGMDYTPSVIRFNLAGASGILMLSNYLTKRQVQLRQSQVKFDSTRLTLQVIEVSKPNKVYLNRKVVLALTSLGVKNYVFQDLLNEAMTQYKKYMLPKDELSYDLMVDYYSEGTMNDFQAVIDHGFLDSSDPFINNLTSAYQNGALRAIQEDCKLHVRQAVRVFAVMDETGMLAPNEVFLQITDTSGLASMRKVIAGPCLVYRDHSCYPGDFRVVQAVDEPKLRHYTNILVYSSFGPQDLPSTCSNDATDQGNFTVIWDSKLIPPRTVTTPRNYETTMTLSELNKIAFKEIAKFFTTYISMDRLGVLENAFIAISDRHKEGILHGDCIYLSQQIARALDFASTGVNATMYKYFQHYPFPDFMKANSLRTYSSKKPTGEIYRISTQIPAKPYLTNHCAYDPRLHVQGMHEYILDARKIKAEYDHSLRILLGQYSVQTEIELISGHVTQWPKYLSERDRPYYLERVRNAYIRLKTYWRQIFELEFVDYHGHDVNDQIEMKVAAWYYVTYHRSEYKSDVTYNSTMARFMSFPWLLDDYVSFIAGKYANRPHEEKYLEPIPAELINNSTKKNVIMFADEDEDESEEEAVSEEEEGPNTISLNDLVSNDNQQDEDAQFIQNLVIHEQDEVPVLSIKLSDLLK